MASLQAIDVRVEYDRISKVQPVLHEIHQALSTLLAENTSTSIDLTSLPFSPEELDALLTFLGKGEVEAQLRSLGDSMFWETQYAGVWIVEHYNSNQELMNRYVEITWIPEMLMAYSEDIQASIEQLHVKLHPSEI